MKIVREMTAKYTEEDHCNLILKVLGISDYKHITYRLDSKPSQFSQYKLSSVEISYGPEHEISKLPNNTDNSSLANQIASVESQGQWGDK